MCPYIRYARAMLVLKLSLVLIFLSHSNALEDKYNVHDVSSEQLCFLTAVSSNHLHTANAFLKSIQQYYPCGKTYVYDLGLNKRERRGLKALPYVEDVMELVLPVRGKDYFPSGSCAFKPPMILQFIDKYLNNETDCRYFFYGDSVIFFHHKFNRKAFDEVRRLGIVTQSPRREDQISLTHPKMFPYFGFNRESLFNESRKRGGRVMKQIQAGLMMVDASNVTLRDSLFTEWAACAANDDCLIPDKVKINKKPGHPLAIHNISGVRVYRAHRDDQSAFSFVIAKYFGYGGRTSQKVYLDGYVGTFWRQVASHEDLKKVGENCTRNNNTATRNSTHSILKSMHPNSTVSNTSSADSPSENPPAVLQRSSRLLMPKMSLIRFQAALDFIVLIILGVLVGVLFRK